MEKKFSDILAEAKSRGLTDEEISRLPTVKRLARRSRHVSALILAGILLSLVAIGLEANYGLVDLPSLLSRTFGVELQKQPCLFDNIEPIADMMRPYVDCDICRNMTSIEIVYNVSEEEFTTRFAYTSRPVLIRNATSGWSAHRIFSFDYFRELYAPGSPALENTDRDCQFFPYRTSFENLGQVFDMSEERRTGVKGDPWYIGW